jgi:hypothetical protein
LKHLRRFEYWGPVSDHFISSGFGVVPFGFSSFHTILFFEHVGRIDVLVIHKKNEPFSADHMLKFIADDFRYNENTVKLVFFPSAEYTIHLSTITHVCKQNILSDCFQCTIDQNGESLVHMLNYGTEVFITLNGCSSYVIMTNESIIEFLKLFGNIVRIDLINIALTNEMLILLRKNNPEIQNLFVANCGDGYDIKLFNCNVL